MSQPNTGFKGNLRTFLFYFCLFYVIFWIASMWLNPKKENQAEDFPVIVKVQDSTLKIGNLALFTIQNKTDKNLVFISPCSENGSKLGVYGVLAGKRTENLLLTDNCEVDTIEGFNISPGGKYNFDMKYHSNDMFSGEGKYIIEMELNSGEEIITATSPEFEYKEPGAVRKLFRALVSKPLFNTLVLFIKGLPNHSLGWAIVMLTIAVRILLFIPNQKAMKSQREMQKLQPKLQEMKKQYKDNPQVMAMKTMEMYKTHKVNPMASMGPILLQFPILIGTYLIVQQGVSPHQNHLLYSANQGLDLSIVENLFFWMDLTQIDSLYILPVLVAGVQFLTMKLSFAKAKDNTPKKETKSVKKKDTDMPDMADMAQQMQKTMVWMMPIMIGVFTAMFPAGVGVYWFTSTLLGAVQQKLVNWSLDRPQVTRVSK